MVVITPVNTMDLKEPKKRISKWTFFFLTAALSLAIVYMVLTGGSQGGISLGNWTGRLESLLAVHNQSVPIPEEEPIKEDAVSLNKFLLWERVEARQKERKAQLNAVCYELAKARQEENEGKPGVRARGAATRTGTICHSTRAYRSAFVDDKDKVLYWPIAKSGCTSWKRALGIAMGNVTEEDIYQMSRDYRNTSIQFDRPSTAVHYSGYSSKAGFYMMGGRPSDDDVEYKMRDYFKFLFVRDPLERLLSAYRAKILIRDSYNLHNFIAAVGRYINRNFYGSNETNTDNMVITFEEFIRYIVEHYEKGEGLNIHWNSYQTLSPCTIQWDFIGKLETMQEDGDYILQHIMGTNCSAAVVMDQKKSPHGGRSHGKETPHVFHDYYRNLSKPILERICKAVDLDSRMFGFGPKIGWQP